MALRNRKMRVQLKPTCVDLNTLLEPLLAAYPNIIYVGIWYHNGYGYVYVQHVERMSYITLTKLLKDYIEITDISSYSTIVDGELQGEWRLKPFRAKKRLAVNADITTVFVHPLHKESLQHITKEFVVELLKPLPGISVFYKFGLKLYSLDQNSNFKTRKGCKKVRLRCEDGWTVVSKGMAYDEILRILVERTQQCVNMFRKDIPRYSINHFETYVESILDHKNSSVSKYRKLYEARRNKTLDNIAVSMNDRLSRLTNWGGTKVKLI